MRAIVRSQAPGGPRIGAWVFRLRLFAARRPHAALLALVVGALATEPVLLIGREASSTKAYLVGGAALAVRAALAGVCLFAAWEGRRHLRLGPVLAAAAALALGWLAVHVGMDVTPDRDLYFYDEDGSTLLAGRYPESDYPTGAVLLFGSAAWLGESPPHVAHALLMIPFHLAAVLAIWSTATRGSAWLATVVAVWPLNLFHWDLRYDLAPTALLVGGLALALRGRWLLAGTALGIGTAMKWSPALAFFPLVVWLLVAGRRRAALRLTGPFVLSVVVLTAPFLVWESEHVLATYRFQADRGITGESVWYLPLAAAGLVERPEHLSLDADAPVIVDSAVTAVQVALVAAVVVLAARARSPGNAIALAALAPAVFLLTNRVFSSQFIVLLMAVWALAAALVARSAREQLAVGGVAGAASFANALVHPYTVQFAWELLSVVFFVLAAALTVWLVRRGAGAPASEPP